MRRWGILGVGLGEALIAVNFSIVSTALATIQKEFHASLLQIQWMLNIFGIFMCVSLVLMGRLADSYGRKKVFMVGLAGSGVASLIAGFAPTASWIIAAQLVQGVAGAILLAVSQALMTHLFPAKQRSIAIGVWAAIAGITLGLGPLLGGAIIDFIGWRWIFFINVPTAIVALGIVGLSIRESKNRKPVQEDVFGTLLLMLTIGSFVLGVIQGPSWGWVSLPSLACCLTFFTALPAFIYVEAHAPFPIIQPQFFLQRAFLLPSLTNFCLIFFMWTLFFFLPLYFQQVKNYSPFQTGVLMLLVTAPVALFSHPVGRWYAKVGPKILIVIGFFLLMASIFLQFFFGPSSLLPLNITASLFFGFGWVLVWGPSTTAAISSVPREHAGIASGAFTTIQEIGATVGLTITGTVFRSSASPFMEGFRHSLWILLSLMVVGVIAAMKMEKRIKF
jgi:EmrB/QacA subfamily drug resistance transporter